MSCLIRFVIKTFIIKEIKFNKKILILIIYVHMLSFFNYTFYLVFKIFVIIICFKFN